MKDKHHNNADNLVIGKVSRTRSLRRRLRQHWKQVVIGVAIVVVAAGAGVTVRLLQNKEVEQHIVFPGRQLPKKVDDAQNLRVSGDLGAAGKVIDEALADPKTTDEEKYMLYIQQGNIASDKKDYAAAAASYEKAAAIKQTYEVYTLLGQTWRYAKDNARAAASYKKALPLMPQTPVAAADKEVLERLIASLEGGPPLEGRPE